MQLHKIKELTSKIYFLFLFIDESIFENYSSIFDDKKKIKSNRSKN